MNYTFLTIYRLSISPPEEINDVINFGNFLITLAHGPFQIQHSVPIYLYGDGVGGITTGVEDVLFSYGAYLLLRHEINDDYHADIQADARIFNSEILSILDMKLEGLIGERVFEGAVNKPGQVVFAPEGPIKVFARPPVTREEVSSAIADGLTSLGKLSEEERQRLRLMSRWFRRAKDTLNKIDQFLFFYFAVEVYPAFGTTKVTEAIRDFLHKNIFPDVSPAEIKRKLMLGKITGFRAKIVHDGKASISADEKVEFNEMLERLHSLAFTCMCYLATGEYRGTLDRWIRNSVS